MPEKKKVLIIEDDPKIVELLRLHLKDAGYMTEWAGNGLKGLELALTGSYSLIILDLMLPGIDGLEVCRKIRRAEIVTPLLMLTAKSEELDKVLGLELGADDYITKPFSIRELMARIKALLRRSEITSPAAQEASIGKVLEFEEIIINPGRRTAFISGRALELTAKEYDLLHLFVSNPGRAYNRQELLDKIWGYSFKGYEHTVNTHINRLRNKIEKNPAEPAYIKTVWGFGYRFAEKTGEEHS
jgi:two-component system, OmpR family, alkaline phosphatase synthesis response regulator PhoP